MQLSYRIKISRLIFVEKDEFIYNEYMKKKTSSLAAFLGTSYAHVQHGIDLVIGWGFRKMKEQGIDSGHNKAKKPVSKVESTVRSALHFLGSAGDAYMKKYEELKKKTL